jgi:hypothetical protein
MSPKPFASRESTPAEADKMNRKLALLCLIVPLAFGVIRAQSPTVVVQAASPVPVASTTAPPPSSASDSKSLPTLIKLLQEMKTTNEETLKKQEAALQQLDDLQKAADQMKAFSQRG